MSVLDCEEQQLCQLKSQAPLYSSTSRLPQVETLELEIDYHRMSVVGAKNSRPRRQKQ